jgi:hypothetical protein
MVLGGLQHRQDAGLAHLGAQAAEVVSMAVGWWAKSS